MNLTKELTDLTCIPEKLFEKLSNNVKFLILQSLQETLIKKEAVCEINLGLGELLISLEDDELRFKFIPSKDLEKDILKTIETEQNPMEKILSNNMVKTLERTYKELL